MNFSKTWKNHTFEMPWYFQPVALDYNVITFSTTIFYSDDTPKPAVHIKGKIIINNINPFDQMSQSNPANILFNLAICQITAVQW